MNFNINAANYAETGWNPIYQTRAAPHTSKWTDIMFPVMCPLRSCYQWAYGQIDTDLKNDGSASFVTIRQKVISYHNSVSSSGYQGPDLAAELDNDDRGPHWRQMSVGLPFYHAVLAAPGPKQSVLSLMSCDDDYKDPSYADDDGNQDEDDLDGEADSLPSKIVSQGGKKTFSIGDTITLPCEVHNRASAVIQWRRGPRKAAKPLFFDRVPQTTNPRFDLDDQYSLHIKDLQEDDADEYYCQIIGKDDILVYTVEVLTKPKILRLYPEGTSKTLKKGSPLTLMCEAVGEPKPKISWTHKKKHSHVEESFSDDSITIDKVSRKHSGDYTCTVNNGKGTDKQTITVIVEYEPEIEINSEVVHSGEGYESELTCVVHAHPGAKVTWFKNDQPLKESHHISQVKNGSSHSLRISATKKTDFGNYKCVANNSIGTTSKAIALSGLPPTPVFESTTSAEDGKSPRLTWKVISRSPIEQFELMYRKQEDDQWKTASPLVTTEGESIYIARYTLKNLEQGTYFAKIRAKNSYGWSSLSEMKSFSGVHNSELV
ncbi:unnamed protein product [Nezara viridula]|uniref:Uncharacterized protein n=1 Tax=Nezara viridula TaxID=85310 RepID=A0A9P0E3H1_NEZVI|nr:unnamed protein product [Nezara viridula]